jgi:hypothetical protein
LKPIAGRRSDEVSDFAKKHDVVVKYLLAMLADCCNNLTSYGHVDFERDSETIRTRFAHEGLSFATRTLPAFFDSILNYLETGVSYYPSFKLTSRGYPAFLQQLTRTVYERPYEQDTAKYMQHLYQLCVSFKKLKGPYRKGVLDSQQAEFVKVDRSLPKEFGPMCFESQIIDRASKIIGEVVKGLNPFDPDQAERFVPRPGPGATNTPTETHERYRPHVKYTNLNEDFPYDEWFHPPSTTQQISRWDLRVGKKRRFSDLIEKSAPTARLKFVFKTFGKARGICIEELEAQWLQQALRRGLYDVVEHHPVTKGKVNFTNQHINAVLALKASCDRRKATIDMSSASDRIARWLVRRLFCKNTELCKALLTLSTERVELPGKKFPLVLNKFAPMGSALCFPIMGLVHYALISSIIFFFGPPHLKFSDVHVYGDDIIVDSDVAELVYRYLPLFGMKLNKEKSFYNSYFRESCGMNAYLGMDITPTRFKSVVKFPPRNDELISALQNEGALYRKGFYEIAKLLRAEILHLRAFRAEFFPKVHCESGLLGWIREDFDAMPRFNTVSRWNKHIGEREYKVCVLVERREKPPLLSDVDGYLRNLTVKTESDARQVGGNPGELQIRRKWAFASEAIPLRPQTKLCLDRFFGGRLPTAAVYPVSIRDECRAALLAEMEAPGAQASAQVL